MTQPVHSKEDEILDNLLQQKDLGSPGFAQHTLEAIRADMRRRRILRFRLFLGSAGGIAASLAFIFALWQPATRSASEFTEFTPSDTRMAAEAALYGEMLALEDLLQPADGLAAEESQQTLSFLIALSKN